MDFMVRRKGRSDDPAALVFAADTDRVVIGDPGGTGFRTLAWADIEFAGLVVPSTGFEPFLRSAQAPAEHDH